MDRYITFDFLNEILTLNFIKFSVLLLFIEDVWHVYSQKNVDPIKILVLPRYNETLKNLAILQISRIFSLHNNNAQKLLKNW